MTRPVLWLVREPDPVVVERPRRWMRVLLVAALLAVSSFGVLAAGHVLARALGDW